MASRKLFEPSTALYQDGRGSEPMIEVGSTAPADALHMGISSRLFLSHSLRSRHARESGHPVTPGVRIVRPRPTGSPAFAGDDEGGEWCSYTSEVDAETKHA